MAEYDFYTRAELMDLLKFNEAELNKQMVKAEPTEAAAKTAAGNVKTLLKNKIKDIKATLKANMAVATPPQAAAEPAAQPTYDLEMVKTMKENATIQNLLEVVRAVQKLNVGDSIERFVSELDQIYKVEVEPQVGEVQSLEAEFVRAAKRLLTFSMYEQMDKSGTNTTTWAEMKKYLVENHGSKITMFQHLNRLWKLEIKADEKLTDYGARLEEQIHKASLHIMKKFGKDHKGNDDRPKDMAPEDVFKLIGAMLASLQVQKEHEDVFKSMIKNMDKHWSAGSLLADAQDYVDRLGANHNATKTGVEVAFHSTSNRNKSSNQKKSSTKSTSDESSKAFKDIQKQLEANAKAIQSLTLTNKSAQTGERSTTLTREEARKIMDAGRDKPVEKQICLPFLRGDCIRKGKCKYGRKHVKDYKVYMTAQEEVQPEVHQGSSDIDALFH